MREHTAFKNQLLVSVFCYILAVGFVFFNIVARIGFTLPVKEYFFAAGLSFFFCSLGVIPQLIHRKSTFLQVSYITLAAFFIICVLSFFPELLRLWAGYLIVGAGWLMMLYIIYLTWISFTWKHQLYFSIVAGFFAVWCVSTVYYHSGYVTPLFREELACNIMQTDLIHNMSIAQMIKTYGVISTGLDGLTVTPYHYGSHWVFARLSTLFNCSMIEIYNIFYPILFITLFYYWLLQAALKRGSHLYKYFNIQLTDLSGKIFWLLFLILIIGFLPIEYAYKFGIDRSNLNSQSYLFSLIFLFITFTILHDYNQLLVNQQQLLFSCLIAVMVMIIYIMKLSVGFLLIPFIGYLQFRHHRFFTISNLLIWAASLSILFFVHRTVSSDVIVEYGLFDYVKRFTEPNIRHYFLPVYFIVPILYLLIRSMELDQLKIKFHLFKSIQKRESIDIEILLIIVFISLLPGNLMVINGNSGNYFSDVPRQLANILVLATVPFVSTQISYKPSYVRFSLVLLLVFTFGIGALATITHHIHYDITKNFVLRYSITGEQVKVSQSYTFIQNRLDQNPKFIFIKKLDSLNNLPVDFKSKHVVNIPRTDTGYYYWLGSWPSVFIVPSVTGIAMLNGLPTDTTSVFMKKGYYNFISYQKRKEVTLVDTINSPLTLKARLEKLNISDKKIITLHTDFESK